MVLSGEPRPVLPGSDRLCQVPKFATSMTRESALVLPPEKQIMQVVLRIANGKSNVRQVRLHADTTIGRSPDCQLKVASNQISRRHCQIVIREMSVAIKDLGSANGTFVNGRQIPPEVEVPLTPGTRVALGPLQFSVEYDLPGFISATPALSQHEEGDTTLSDDAVTRNVAPGTDANPAMPGTIELSPPVDGPSPLMETVRSGEPLAGVEIRHEAASVAASALARPVEVHLTTQMGGVMPSFDPRGVVMQPPMVPLDPGAPPAGPELAPDFPQPWDPQHGPVTSSSVTIVPGSVPPLAQFIPQEQLRPGENAMPDAAAIPQVWPGHPISNPLPVAAPVAPFVPAAAVENPFAPPEWQSSADDQQAATSVESASVLEEDEGTFNFGIYAATGSGIIVESSTPDSIGIAPTESTTPAASEARSGKKGLLQMLGWGKKKPVPPAPAAAAPPAPDVVPALSPAFAEPVTSEDPSFAPPAFEIPEETETEEDREQPPEDDSLQSFFNQFK